MSTRIKGSFILLLAIFSAAGIYAQDTVPDYSRDPNQRIDDWYTKQIAKYTTGAALNSPLTDYLPASETIPTPAKILGDVAGAPNMLPYAEDVYRYFRLLAASTPRVKVFSIGRTEEGREMIAVAVADESLLAKASENGARLAQLADPRTIGLNDATADKLVAQSFPVYYITGTIHSPETGAPTALMELAYRLAADNAPYVKYIRSHIVTLITPVVEVDGRDRMVDIYRWHRAHPDQNWPHLLYWGHYVAHDNNRDAMGMTLALTNHVLNTYLEWHAQVLHDLHESVPFLYDNTVGDGPYNAWIDPMLADEWAALGWNNVQAMQNFGMPGVFTHGNFDTWSPGYLMFLAGLHNGISRLYETFGNGGADTEERILTPDEYSRTWYRQNPPYPTVTWSQRDNNNYEETALLSTLFYFSQNSKHFLKNYYLKSKRSVEKPRQEGPAAYVLTASEGSQNRQLELLKVLAAQHVEVERLDEPVTVTIPAPAHAEKSEGEEEHEHEPAKKPKPQTFPVGSFVVRMDQPFSRVADALLDRQYWSPNDPQKHPYDDTGWSFGELFHADCVRVTDPAVLKARMEPLKDISALAGRLSGSGGTYAINNTGQVSLAAVVYALKGADISISDAAFDAGGHHFNPGSLLIGQIEADQLKRTLSQLNLNAEGIASVRPARTHKAETPRIAFMHTWLYTQAEGWWREVFDNLHIPYDYISTQAAAREPDLRSKYDVIIFAPVAHASAQQIVDGLPMWGNPLPWRKSELTPNLGKLDSTEDMRPGLGQAGVEHLRAFVEGGGLLITCEDTAKFAIEEGLAPGVFVAPEEHGHEEERAPVDGSVLNAVAVDKAQPLAYGYDGDIAVYSQDGLAFEVSDLTVNRKILTEQEYKRPTGRGGPEDEDMPEGRPIQEAPVLPSPKPWQATPLNAEQERNNPYVIPVALRPTVIFRYGEAKSLLRSGLLEDGAAIAERAVVVEAHVGKGHVLLFANNPVYRGETIGTYAQVFNALINFEHLSAASGK